MIVRLVIRVFTALIFISFAATAPAQGYRYEWFGGAEGYSGYIILDMPSSGGGGVANILSGQIVTPVGTHVFRPDSLTASRPLFTWNEKQITYMYFAWISNAPYSAFGANFDANFNGIPRTFVVSMTGSGKEYLDDSGLWLAADAQVAPQFKIHPVAQSVVSGATVTFTARAIGKPAPVYQWQKDGADIPGATDATYTIPSAYSEHVGSYVVVARNLSGATASNAATLGITVAAPTFITQPFDQAVVPGEQATFVVSASGVSVSGFRWQRRTPGTGTWLDLSNGAHYSGVSSATLVVSGTETSMHGAQFRCVATNAVGTAVSSVATLSVVSFVSTVAKVETGDGGHTMLLKTNGTLWGTGSNYQGQLGDGTLSEPGAPVQIASEVIAMAAGYQFTMFIKADGTLWATGDNSVGQLGDGTMTGRSIPVQIATNVASVSAGSAHALFVKTDGTLWAVGHNNAGQLGDGTTSSRSTPVQVAQQVLAAAAGGTHSLFIKIDGTLWAMGDNGSGQLGDGTLIERRLPVQVAAGVTAVSAGSIHSMAVKADGSLWGTGYNAYGSLGDGTNVQRNNWIQVASHVASVSAGEQHTLFVKSDGTLWSMGLNSYGELGYAPVVNRTVPAQVAEGVISASASTNYSMFVLADHTLWSSGRNPGWSGVGVPHAATLPIRVSPVTMGFPLIVSQSPGLTVAAGSAVTFSLKAHGTPAPSYQWFKDGIAIPGETGSTISLASAPVSAAGDYTVQISNLTGSVQSRSMRLKVTMSADFNADGIPDLLWQNTATGQRALWLMNGGDFTPTQIVSLGWVSAEWSMAAATDFNADGKVDILWQNTATGQRALWLMNGGDFTPTQIVSLGWVSAEWSMAAATDFNADGKVDILWQNTVTGQRALWLMNGGDFTPTQIVSLGWVSPEWTMVAATDFNADGKVDILWQNTVTGQRALWLMNGGDFTPTQIVSLGWVDPAWTMANAADFNADGKVDILWQNTVTGQRALWLMNGGDFTPLNVVNLGFVATEWRITR